MNDWDTRHKDGHEPPPMWQVAIEHPSGSVESYLFSSEAEADQFAMDYYTPMDTSEARDTVVAVNRKGTK